METAEEEQLEIDRIEREDKAARIELYEYVRDFAVTKADTEDFGDHSKNKQQLYDVEKQADHAYFILAMDQVINSQHQRYKNNQTPATHCNDIAKAYADCSILLHDYPLRYLENGGIFQQTAQMAILRQMQRHDIAQQLEHPKIKDNIGAMLSLNRIPPPATYGSLADLWHRAPEKEASNVMLTAVKCIGNLIESQLPPLVDYGIPRVMKMLEDLDDHIQLEVAKTLNKEEGYYDSTVMNEIYQTLSEHIMELDWQLDMSSFARRKPK